MNSLDWYLLYIKDELKQLEEGKFTGNIEFKVNLREGGIAHINISLNKSVKKPSR